MEADAAEVAGAVDDGNPVAEFGGFDGSMVTGGTAADYQEIVVVLLGGFGTHLDLIVPQFGGVGVIT